MAVLQNQPRNASIVAETDVSYLPHGRSSPPLIPPPSHPTLPPPPPSSPQVLCYALTAGEMRMIIDVFEEDEVGVLNSCLCLHASLGWGTACLNDLPRSRMQLFRCGDLCGVSLRRRRLPAPGMRTPSLHGPNLARRRSRLKGICMLRSWKS